MNESTSTFSTGTLQAWMRLPKFVQLGVAIAAAVAISALAASVIRTPSPAPTIAPAAAATSPPTRDPSVPAASEALSADDRQQAVWTPTF